MGRDKVIKLVVFSSSFPVGNKKIYFFYQNDINICNAATFSLYDWQHD